MFFTKFRRNASLLLGAGVMSLMMVGCGTDGAADVGTVQPPAVSDKVTIGPANADKVLASSVGGIGKLAGMVDGILDNLPGLGTTDSKIAQAASGTNIDGTMAVSSDALALDLVSRDCSDGGSISVDGVSTSGGSVSFNHCQERGVILDGAAEVSYGGGSYSIRFTDLSAGFSTGTLYLSDAGATVSGSNMEFVIASGTANVQGMQIEVKNFALNKVGSGVTANGSVRTDCMGGWVDVTTVTPLAFNSSELLVGGALTVTGNGTDMQITIKADGSVEVLLNGAGYATYDSAADLPQYNAVCP